MASELFFSPSFGNRPKELIGRDDVIINIMEGLKTPPGSRERATILIGQRGAGKTVLLLELMERGQDAGFITLSPTIADNELMEKLVYKLQDEGELYLKKKKGKLSGGTIGVLGFSAGLQFTPEIQEQRSNTYKFTKLCEALNSQGKGVLILVDEIQSNVEELRKLIIAYQEMVGKGSNVAIVMAGLPQTVSSMLNDHVLTFFNRARKIILTPLRDVDIDAYFYHSFKSMGLKVKRETQKELVSAAKGSPYMMQLIGYYVSKYAGGSTVDQEVVELSLDAAKEDFMNDVCAASLHGLSVKDIRFLQIMAEFENEVVRVCEIKNRMGVSSDYIQQYKKRLLDAGLIIQPKRGEVAFAVPYFKEYMERYGE